MELIIELGEGGRAGYGSIHRKGCADVADPETIGNAETLAAAVILADQTTAWARNDGCDPADIGYKIASCVKFPAS